MGTTGILEATCNLLAMNAGFLPPTINFKGPRAGCTLDYIPNVAREKNYKAFISANYAFGGNNASVVITAWDAVVPQRSNSSERVVITGAGAVTSLGLTLDSTLDALKEGRSGIGSVASLGLEPLDSKMAGLVPYFKAADIDRRLDFTGMNHLSRMAVAASFGALQDADLKIRAKNSEETGIVMGVCNGPPESDHMNKVFSSPDFACDINNFSNITANSTAGWVAGALQLKGVNMTLSPGHHAGIQSLAYAYEMLADKRANAIIAAGSDEVYPQTFFNYNLIGYLYSGEREEQYTLHPDDKKRKVLGEGAASLLLETLTSAKERNAKILGEILSYGMTMDGGVYDRQSLEPDGLISAIRIALSRAQCDADAIDCIVWAPQGNAQDVKVLDAINSVFTSKAAAIPLITSTFNTGYIETASLLLSLGLVLRSLERGDSLWQQKTGVPDIDGRNMNSKPRCILSIGSSDVGYNFAAVIATGENSSE
jgi:3-oxoacyl-[acyl-carrier-protein] synthase II